MTETEEKVYMINSLADIKDAINEEGGNITDSTPYSDYASKISSATNIEELTVTPSTSAQTITAEDCDGFSPVKVSAVTSSIDANIQPENIKSGVTILGVEGTLSASLPTGQIAVPKTTVTGVIDVNSAEPEVGDFVTVMKYTAGSEDSNYDTGYYLFQNVDHWQIDYSSVAYSIDDELTFDSDVDWLALGKVVSIEDGSYTVDVIGATE